jgi:hypothetical protein
MSFASGVREMRRCALTMLETHIVMSSLIFRLVLILMICLSSLMDLTITHIILVHERAALCLNALDTAHVCIVVIVSHVDLVFLLEILTLTLSLDIWTVRVFPVVVHIPLDHVVRC